MAGAVSPRFRRLGVYLDSLLTIEHPACRSGDEETNRVNQEGNYQRKHGGLFKPVPHPSRNRSASRIESILVGLLLSLVLLVFIGDQQLALCRFMSVCCCRAWKHS